MVVDMEVERVEEVRPAAWRAAAVTEEVAAVVTVEEEVEEEVCTYDARRVHAETGVARWCLATRVAAHTLGDTLCRRAACSDCMHTPLAACPSTRTRIRPRHRHCSTTLHRRGEARRCELDDGVLGGAGFDEHDCTFLFV